MSALDQESIAHANQPWDGIWRVRKPATFIAGLYRLHQVTAFQLLQSGAPLTNWEAALLQTIVYEAGDLAGLQRHWLWSVSEQHEEMAA
jgi:hypothetical protein